jgi:hypothetical protein
MSVRIFNRMSVAAAVIIAVSSVILNLESLR